MSRDSRILKKCLETLECQRNENLEYQNMSRNLELSLFNKYLETLENNKIIVQKRYCKISNQYITTLNTIKKCLETLANKKMS